MRSLPPAVQFDLAGSTSSSFYVALVEFDAVEIFLSDRAGVIGGDEILPGVLKWNSVTSEDFSFSVESSVLPEDAGFWVNRKCSLYLVADTDSDVRSGELLSSGSVLDEPSDEAGALSVRVGGREAKPVMIPSGEAIDTTTYPNADSSAVGKYAPRIFGTAERVELLPVDIPKHTTLTEDFEPYQSSITVADATIFPNSGSVYIDGILYEYAGKTDNTLSGLKSVFSNTKTTLAANFTANATTMTLTDASKFPAVGGFIYIGSLSATYASRSGKVLSGVVGVTSSFSSGADVQLKYSFYHRSGSAVSIAAVAKYLIAENDISSPANIRAGDELLGYGDVDLDSRTVEFNGVPTIQRLQNTEERLTANFDAVDASTTALNAINCIKAATGFTTQSASTGGNYSVTSTTMIKYDIGEKAFGGYVYKPLDTVLKLRDGVIAGTYTFTVNMAPKRTSRMYHQSTITIGDQSTTIEPTGSTTETPLVLTFSLNLTSNQTEVVIKHSQVNGIWPADRIDPMIDCTIASVTTAYNVSNGLVANVTGSGEIVFPRPTAIGGTDRIISGAYQVAFSVLTSPTMGTRGAAFVKIGGETVWSWIDGSVVYNFNPAVISFDENTDRLSLSVERSDNLKENDVLVAVSSASRTVVLGNLDTAAFAIIKKPSNKLMVLDQTTDMPYRGKIKRSQAVVEFFSTSTAIDTVAAYFDNVFLGNLSFSNTSSGGTVTKTITTDSIGSVSAALQSQYIAGISSNPIGRNDLSITQSETITANLTYAGGAGGVYTNRGWARTPRMPGYIAGSSILVGFTYEIRGAYSVSTCSCTVYAESGNVLATISGDTSVAEVATGLRTKWVALTTLPYKVTFEELKNFGTDMYCKNVYFEWNAKITEAAIVLSGGGISGTGYINNGNTSLNVGQPSQPYARVDGSSGANNFQMTVPSAPRTVINAFDLPLAATLGWSYFTNKKLKLEYGGAGTADIYIVRAFLIIDYDKVVSEPASTREALTIDVTGTSGYASDVIKDLLELTGKTVDPVSYHNFHQWCVDRAYVFSRVVNSPVEANSLLTYAVEQSLVRLVDDGAKVKIVRELDLTSDVTDITEFDVLELPKFSWMPVDSRFNKLHLSYARVGDDVSKLIKVDRSTPNRWSVRSYNQIKDERLSEYEANWIADTNTAEIYSEDWLSLNAPMRRMVRMALPYTFNHLEEGDLIRYGDSLTLYRISSLSRDADTFISLDAEEIPE